MRLIFLVLIAGLSATGSGFRAAAAKVDITPSSPQWLMGYADRQSTGVLDHIYVRVAAMEADGVQMYLVSSDLCLFSPSVYDEVAAELERTLGIPRLNFWWGVTHSHAAPEVGPPGLHLIKSRGLHQWNREYAAFARQSVILAVTEARGKLEPARISFGQGVAFANINRRAKDVTGPVFLGFNPDGPADRQIGLIRLERPDGSPIALLANYAMHGTVMGGENLKVSGDAPGVVESYLEQKLNVPVLYFNGAAGNLAPIYTGRRDAREGHLSQFRVLLGDRVLQAISSMGPPADNVKLWTGEKIITTPRKEGLEWPETLSRYAALEGDPSKGRPMVKLPIRFLRINDTLIWSAPVEMFCEIAMAVRNASPFLHTFYFGYANGSLAYLPTAQAFAEGGYEPNTSIFTSQAETDVTQGVIAYIQGLR
jgi:hypothetical protein